MEEVEAILASDQIQNEDKFQKLIETKAFKLSPTGVSAFIVHFFLQFPNGNELLYNMISAIFTHHEAIGVDTILEIILFWLRSSDENSIEYQIEFLENFAAHIRQLINLEAKPGSNIPKLIIHTLLEKCSFFILPDPSTDIVETMKSRELLENTTKFNRMENSFALKGRILLAASKLFPVLVEKPAPKKQQTNEFEVDKDESLISQALKKSSSNPTNPLIFKSVARFLKNAKCVSYENRIKRPPARVLTSLEGISSQQLQDPEVCLQIAIMCVILQPPEDTTFDGFVKDFASLCKIDGKMILDLVKSSIQTTLPDVSDMDKFRFMQGEPHEEEEEKFEPILRPFDVTFPDETNPMIEISTENTILDENNLNDLFSDDSFYEWRNARYCVANCIDRLDPNSFSFLQ